MARFRIRRQGHRQRPASTASASCRSLALLYALGLDAEDILHHFYNTVVWDRAKDGWKIPFVAEQLARFEADLPVDRRGHPARKCSPPARRSARALRTKAAKDGLADLLLPVEEVVSRFAARDMIDEATGRIHIEAGDELTLEHVEAFDKAGIDRLELLDIDEINTGPWIRNTLKVDKAENRDEGLEAIYKVMRPGEPPTKETAEALFEGLFFDAERYDLSAVGRVKLNMRLGLDAEDTVTTLRKEDILAVVKELVSLKDGKGEVDDIDNLGNRRVRSVGELLENQYRVGLLRMERAVKERMSSVRCQHG